MRSLTEQTAPVRLLAMFVLLTGLPLAALGWLGWHMLDQERDLESQRRRERLENTANQLADRLVKVSPTPAASELPPGVVWLRFDARGLVRRRGLALSYYPGVPLALEAPGEALASAEIVEVTQANPTKAAETYRALAGSPDRATRAAALVRLARALRQQQGRTREALAVYNDLAELGATPVAGAPAELVGRRQRAAMLESAGDTAAAAGERAALAAILADGRYAIDRATFTLYRENLPALPLNGPDLTRVVEEWWPRWKAEPSGRAVWTADGMAFASVWATSAEGTVAMVGYAEAAPITGLGSVTDRRNLLIAGFGLMTLVILSAGYVVFRAVHTELSVARLQSDFVAQVSHEFRTPLTAMRHLTELLEEGTARPDRLAEFHQAIGKETRRLHTMVESLLDFGRIESGRRVYQLEETNAADVARRVVNEFSSPRLHLNVTDGSSRIRADSDALVLAVHNLVDNAMKYSPESTSVTVSVETGGGRTGISVEDRGVGISQAEQRDVRKKFVRGSAARTMNVKGTGIGLAIVEQVAKAHGGRLEVDSQLGRGSRFTIWVPSAEHSS